MTRQLSYGILCAVALVACAQRVSPVHTTSAPMPVAARTTTPPIEVDVEDSTRTEHWLGDTLAEELGGRGIVILPPTSLRSAAYVLHVRVVIRDSDHGVILERDRAPRGSSRVDGAEPPASDEFRDAPSAESPAYTPNGSKAGPPTQSKTFA